jgi:hypothetical protein
MQQHVISAWLLRSFARRAPGGHVLAAYDKATDSYEEVSVAQFLAEVDAHPLGVELDIQQIEGPAARAALLLAKRTKTLPRGLYAVVGSNDPIQIDELPASARVLEGAMLLLSGQQLPSPTDVDRLALARFVALMYVRAPKLEAAAMAWGQAYNEAAQRALDQQMPGIRVDLASDVASLRARMVRRVHELAPVIAASNWWVSRAGANESFVLGDYPIGTTISLGFDDRWRAILAEESFVLTLPLSPAIALVVAPQRIIPMTGFKDPRQAVPAINRLSWRSAGRYVLGRDRQALERATPAEEEDRRGTIAVDIDRDALVRDTAAEVERIVGVVIGRRAIAPVESQFRVMLETWHRWDDCKLSLGFFPFSAADRHLFRPPCTGWRFRRTDLP